MVTVQLNSDRVFMESVDAKGGSIEIIIMGNQWNVILSPPAPPPYSRQPSYRVTARSAL